MRDLTGFTLACALVLACGGGNESCNIATEPLPTPPVPAYGSMTATVNGVTWNLYLWVQPTRACRTCLSINARRAYYSDLPGNIFIGLVVFDTTGAASASVGGDGPNMAAVDSLGSLWESRLPGGSGIVRVTTLTATGASGTFSFTAVPVTGTGAVGTKVVTNGSFNLIF